LNIAGNEVSSFQIIIDITGACFDAVSQVMISHFVFLESIIIIIIIIMFSKS